MRNRKVVVLALLALVLVAPGTRAQDDDAKAHEEKVRKLLLVSGQEDVAKAQFDLMAEQFAKNPQLPPGFAKKFKEISSAKELTDLVVPIYAKMFTDEDLDAIIAFYATPVGKKLAKQQNKIQLEARKAGERWGFAIGSRVARALQGMEDPGDEEKPSEPKAEPEEPKKPVKPEKKDGDF